MFRKMRRFKQQLSDERCIDVLKNSTSGVLALLGDDDYPYAVPLSYIYNDGKIIFHGAKTGHKIDAIKQHDKASFCVVDKDEIIPERYTSNYKSVIAFGKINIIEDDDAIRMKVGQLAEKYRPGHEEEKNKEIDKEFPKLCVFELVIEHITGKESPESIRKMGNK